MQSVAEIKTAQAERYMTQLCKHFAHRMKVTFDDSVGHIEFAAGDCDLAAQSVGLRLTVKAADRNALEHVKGTVARHLVRFAFREDLALDWADSDE